MSVARHQVEYNATPIHTDLYTQAHASLQQRIKEAAQSMAARYEEYRTASLDTSEDAFNAWRQASTRHSALIEAGIIMTLGMED